MEFDPVAYINEPRWMESRLGLERIRELLERLDRPQDRLKFVHVAGTNGKGSTCAFLSSVLQEAGYCTGLFTSPCLIQFEERIRVNGENISRDDLSTATLLVRKHAEAMADHPTEFELMMAIALVHFTQRACEVVVLEVGLGGRFDATNAIGVPQVAVITSIGLDHVSLLGSTLAEIAGEKAGIIKAGAPVVSWPQEPDAWEVVERTAQDHGVELRVPNFAQLVVAGAHRAESGCWTRSFSYGKQVYETQLLGSYQPANAAVALETVDVLRAQGWTISHAAVLAGIASAQWPGRFEVVQDEVGYPTVLVDGGHNPQGALALVASLEDVFPGRKPVFIMGVFEDKDYPAMLEIILPVASAFVTVAPLSPRALAPEKLASAIRWTAQDKEGCSAHTNIEVAENMADALEKARKLAGCDGLICSFGSLYSVGQLKAAL